MQYALAPYTLREYGGFSAWTPPDGYLDAIDLRSLADQSQPGICFVAMPDGPLGRDFFVLGQLDDEPQGILDTWRVLTGAHVERGTVSDLLWQTLTLVADPMGDLRARPLMPERDGFLRLYCGGHTRALRFDPARPECTATLELMREQYRRTRQRSLDGELAAGKHRELLDIFAIKTGIGDTDIFIPADLPRETRRPHQTPIAESFNKTDGAGWNADQTWTGVAGAVETVSNRARGVASTGLYCAAVATANASPDMYAECEIYTTSHDSGDYSGPSARHPSGSTNTQYWIRHFNTTNGQTYKYVGGSLTAIGTNTTSTTMVDGRIARLECEGSSIRRIYHGTTETTTTDSSIDGSTVGGAYGGIRGRRVDGTLHYENDNFATDVLTAGGVAEATGTSTGQGGAAGVGGSTAGTSSSADGEGAGAGVGGSTVGRTGTGTGAGTGEGLGGAIVAATGTAVGGSSAEGVGDALASSATGTAAGSSTALGLAAAIRSATGAAVGSSSATGTGADAGVDVPQPSTPISVTASFSRAAERVRRRRKKREEDELIARQDEEDVRDVLAVLQRVLAG